jgi:hypothetical protein
MTTSMVLADRVLCDLIEQLEETRNGLDATLLLDPTLDELRDLADEAVNSLDGAITYLLRLREERLRPIVTQQTAAALQGLRPDVAQQTARKRRASDLIVMSRGGRAPRQKGNRTERAIVRLLQERGLAADRVPLSGAVRGRFGGDVSVPLLGIDRRVEVKCRCDGFRELYKWLASADLLIIKCDRGEPLVVIPLRHAAEIAMAAERAKGSAA